MRYLTPARDAILERRYAPAHLPRRRTIGLWPRYPGGALQVLQGAADESRSREGCIYRRRLRLVARFGLSAYERARP